MLARALLLFILCSEANPAVITTTLQPQTVAAWDRYITAFDLGTIRPILTPKPDKPVLMDLNVNGEVPEGYIHHWIGAELIPNSTVAAVENVLKDYDHYARIYAP